MSNAPHKAADKVNVFAIVLVGVASALLTWASAVALQGYYMQTSGPVEDERAAMELESVKRTIQAAQVANLQRSEQNTTYADSAEACYRNPIDDAMRSVIRDAQDGTKSLVPAVGPHTTNSIAPIVGYPNPDGTLVNPAVPVIDPTKPKKVTITEDSIQINDKIQFETGSATIAAGSIPLVEEIAAVLLANPRIELIEIAGHTDSDGARDANVALSKSRAEAVVAYLTGRGVEASRLEAAGYGPNKPIADNNTAEGKEKNRRVEFSIIKQRASNDVPEPAKPEGAATPQ